MIEIRHLRLVRAISEEGGVTRAAERLHLTQSAVSHQLAELESRLGVNLFNRVRKRLELTRAGQRVLDLSEKVLPEISQAELELAESVQKRLPVRVCTETFTSYHWITPVIQDVMAGDLNVDIQITLAATDNPVAAIKQGKLDLALVSSAVTDPSIRGYPLFDDEWAVVMSNNHPLAKKKYIQASDLSTHTLVTHKVPRRDTERLRDWMKAQNARMPRIQVVPLTDTIVEMVAAGLGVALMSAWAVSSQVNVGKVITRRFTQNGLKEKWSLVHRADATDHLTFSRLVEMIFAHYSR